MPHLPPRSAEKYIYIVNEIVNARAHWIKTRAHEWSVGVCSEPTNKGANEINEEGEGEKESSNTEGNRSQITQKGRNQITR